MTYRSDDVVEQFYKALINDTPWPHIPRSDVFYVRSKIEEDTGIKYPLDRIERAMYLEGHLNARDVLDPERERDWEIEDKERNKQRTVPEDSPQGTRRP